MKYVKLITIIILMAGFVACEKQIPMTDIEPDPLMVVNGIQQVGQPARLTIEKSSFYIETTEDLRVKDVRADLYVNGEFKESLHVMDSGLYNTYENWETGEEVTELRYAYTYCEGNYLLQTGDRLRFEVSSPEFEKTAVAECTLPAAPDVVSFDTVRVAPDSDYGDVMVYVLALTIDDPVGATYYNLKPQGALTGFTSSDPVFADFMENVQIDDLFGGSEYYGNGPYNMFNDLYFDGKQYAVKMQTAYYSEYMYEPFTVEVTCVDAGFYQYMKSYKAYDYVSGGLLEFVTEPTQVYSNVQNGIGIVGAQSQPVVMTIDLTNVEP